MPRILDQAFDRMYRLFVIQSQTLKPLFGWYISKACHVLALVYWNMKCGTRSTNSMGIRRNHIYHSCTGCLYVCLAYGYCILCSIYLRSLPLTTVIINQSPVLFTNIFIQAPAIEHGSYIHKHNSPYNFSKDPGRIPSSTKRVY